MKASSESGLWASFSSIVSGLSSSDFGFLWDGMD